MEHGCSLATVAANDEPALVGTTWTLLCPLIYHFFIFSASIFFCDMSTVHFFISWDVSIELLYAHISQISNTTNSVFMFFCVWSQNSLNICFSSLQTYNLYIYDFKVRYVDKYLTNMYEFSDLVKSF
jgi:hypothetical protein